MIISRYLLQQVFRALVAVTLVLLLVFVSQQMIRYLSYAASGKIPPGVMVQVIGYQIPFLLALMLPPGLYFAILLTYGRLYSDNELRVLHACGFSQVQLIRITAILAVAVALLTMVLTFWANPRIAAGRQQALTVGAERNMLETLMPGRFRVDQDGDRVIYVEKISRDHQNASNVFVAYQKPAVGTDEAWWVVLSAAKGYQETDALQGGRFLVAEDGYRYEGIPGHRNYRIFHFGRHAVRLPDVEAAAGDTIMDAMPMHALWSQWPEPMASAELQWRASIPLSALILALLAVPLSPVPPRRSRYRGLVPAVLLYVIYMNLLIAGRHLIEQQSISVMVGLWWVHLLFVPLIATLVIWRMRRA